MPKHVSQYLAPIIVGILVLFLGFCIGSWFNLYERFSLFDKIVHFLGGATVAFFFSRYYAIELQSFTLWKKTLLLVAFACLVGVFWEFAEYTSSIFAPVHAPFIYKHFYIGNLTDTIGDLIADVLGALVFALLWTQKK